MLLIRLDKGQWIIFWFVSSCVGVVDILDMMIVTVVKSFCGICSHYMVDGAGRELTFEWASIGVYYGESR